VISFVFIVDVNDAFSSSSNEFFFFFFFFFFFLFVLFLCFLLLEKTLSERESMEANDEHEIERDILNASLTESILLFSSKWLNFLIKG
jgi:hypothetical protein